MNILCYANMQHVSPPLCAPSRSRLRSLLSRLLPVSSSLVMPPSWSLALGAPSFLFLSPLSLSSLPP